LPVARMLFQVRAADIGFLIKVHGVIFHDKKRSCEIPAPDLGGERGPGPGPPTKEGLPPCSCV